MLQFSQIPAIHIEDQQVTSLPALFSFRQLFTPIEFKQQLKKCLAPLKGPAMSSCHFLIVHIWLAFHRLRKADHYRDDPIAPRLIGVSKTPDDYHCPTRVHDSHGAAGYSPYRCIKNMPKRMKISGLIGNIRTDAICIGYHPWWHLRDRADYGMFFMQR